MKRLLGEAVASDAMPMGSLRGMDLRPLAACRATLDLAGWDLRGCSFRGMVLEGARFNGADLRGADFGCALFKGWGENAVNFEGSDLRGACFENAEGAPHLAGADLRGANLAGMKLRGLYGEAEGPTALNRVDLRGACLDRVNLAWASLMAVDLSNASLKGACLANVQFLEVSAFEADFRGADLKCAFFRDERVRWYEPAAQGAYWNQAQLYGANLEGVDRFAGRFLSHGLGLVTEYHPRYAWVGVLSRVLGGWLVGGVGSLWRVRFSTQEEG